MWLVSYDPAKVVTDAIREGTAKLREDVAGIRENVASINGLLESILEGVNTLGSGKRDP